MTGTARPLDQHTRLSTLGSGPVLTPAFRLGTEDMAVASYLPKTPARVREHNLEPIRVLLDEAMNRHNGLDRATSDAWLGPRLHSTLRLSRREAGNRGVWRFLGLWGADYVRWRFGPADATDVGPCPVWWTPGDDRSSRRQGDRQWVRPEEASLRSTSRTRSR